MNILAATPTSILSMAYIAGITAILGGMWSVYSSVAARKRGFIPKATAAVACLGITIILIAMLLIVPGMLLPFL